MGEDGQRFPAWPLITAVVRHSQRTGSYTARIDYPSAPARLLSRTELQPLRGEVISQVQRWTNDEWHKPVRLEVDDPDGRWLLGIPRAGAPVDLDALAPAGPPPAALPTPARYRPHARFTGIAGSARARRRRLAALAGVILALATLVVIVAAALAGGSTTARHHQTPRWPHRDPRRSRDHRCAAHPAGGHGHPAPVLNPAAPPGRPAGAPPRPRAPQHAAPPPAGPPASARAPRAGATGHHGRQHAEHVALIAAVGGVDQAAASRRSRRASSCQSASRSTRRSPSALAIQLTVPDDPCPFPAGQPAWH